MKLIHNITGFLLFCEILLVSNSLLGQDTNRLKPDSIVNYTVSSEAAYFLSFPTKEHISTQLDKPNKKDVLFTTKDTLIQVTQKVLQKRQIIEEVHVWPNGKIKMQRYYSSYQPFGNWYYYSPSGSLKYEFNQTINGYESFVEYYPNGQVKFIETKAPNQLQIGYKSFYNNGEMYETGSLFQASNSILKSLNCVRHGRWKVHFPNGKIRRTGKYNIGKRVGKWSFYSYSGKCEKEIYYKSGVLKKQEIHH